MNNFYELSRRKVIPIYTKFKQENKSQVVNSKKQKLYDYYKCDYCESEIKTKNNKADMTGGIVKIPKSITKKNNINLVLCNKCLNPVLKIFE